MSFNTIKVLPVFFLMAVALSGCVTIAPETVSLQKSVCDEGERMHKITLALVNNLFEEKKKAVDKFIEDDFKPKFITKLKADAEKAGKKPAENIDDFSSAVETEVAVEREKLYKALETTRNKLADKINADYDVFNNGCRANEKYLNSLVKVDKERKALLQQLVGYTGLSLNVDDISKQIDDILNKGGESGQIIEQLGKLIK